MTDNVVIVLMTPQTITNNLFEYNQISFCFWKDQGALSNIYFDNSLKPKYKKVLFG